MCVKYNINSGMYYNPICLTGCVFWIEIITTSFGCALMTQTKHNETLKGMRLHYTITQHVYIFIEEEYNVFHPYKGMTTWCGYYQPS